VSCKNTHKRGCKYSLVAEVITNHYIDLGNLQAFRDVVTEFFDFFLSTFVLTSPAFSALFKLVFISVIKIDSILKTSVIFQLVLPKTNCSNLKLGFEMGNNSLLVFLCLNYAVIKVHPRLAFRVMYKFLSLVIMYGLRFCVLYRQVDQVRILF
jgi:hypothetical protein